MATELFPAPAVPKMADDSSGEPKKKRAKCPATQLTLKHLRAAGYTAQVVEVWNPHARVRNDLFGFVDVLALKGGETLAVQTTSVANVSTRIRKIAESPLIAAVREAGWSVRVHGWSKVKGRWVLARDEDLS